MNHAPVATRRSATLLRSPIVMGVNAPSFSVPLQASLIPDRNVGVGTFTFARAITAYVLGYAAAAVIADGPVLLLCASGEAQFMGARRVSEGVWSAVDANGVALTTTNGASSLCCDASGPKGLLTEAAAQNLALQSQDFATTWSVGNDVSVGVNADVAPDGTTTADRLVEGSALTTHFILQAYTLTAANHTVTIFAKAGTRSILRVVTPTGASYEGAWNLTLGTVIANVVGSPGIATTIEPYPNGWYKCRLTFLGTAASYQFRLYLDDGTGVSYQGNGTGYVSIWQYDGVMASFASTPITTTTVAVTRNASVAQGVSAGNISATATSLTMEITPSTVLGSTVVFHWASYVDASNYTAWLSDGTNLIARKRIGGVNADATIAWTRTAGTTIHAFARFDTANGVDVGFNGTLGTPDTTTTASQIGTNWQIGADGNGANQDYCEHRFFVAYTSSVATGRLQAMTA